jgi:hypothetical protein
LIIPRLSIPVQLSASVRITIKQLSLETTNHNKYSRHNS